MKLMWLFVRLKSCERLRVSKAFAEKMNEFMRDYEIKK